jgi:hypothetical protein
MRLRRDVLIAVLVTFCLTSALFTVKPSGSQSTLSYNPWMDINDDGRIDIYDVVSVTAIYGKTGDPTKNVSVSNYGFKVLSYDINITANTGGCINIPVSGYRQITLHFNPIYSVVVYILGWPYKIRYDRGDNVSVALAFSVGGTFEKLTTFNTNITVSTNPYQPQWYMGTPSLISFTYDIKGEEFLIGYYNPTTKTQRLKISVYLTD